MPPLVQRSYARNPARRPRPRKRETDAPQQCVDSSSRLPAIHAPPLPTYTANDPGRTRTCNPRLRRPMPYPLGHGACAINDRKEHGLRFGQCARASPKASSLAMTCHRQGHLLSDAMATYRAARFLLERPRKLRAGFVQLAGQRGALWYAACISGLFIRDYHRAPGQGIARRISRSGARQAGATPNSHVASPWCHQGATPESAVNRTDFWSVRKVRHSI